jgi:hypothetical protein
VPLPAHTRAVLVDARGCASKGQDDGIGGGCVSELREAIPNLGLACHLALESWQCELNTSITPCYNITSPFLKVILVRSRQHCTNSSPLDSAKGSTSIFISPYLARSKLGIPLTNSNASTTPRRATHRLIVGPPKSSPVERVRSHGIKFLPELSAVDKRTRAVVLELLVSDISVQFCNIPNLVLMYLRYPDLARKTRVLELKRSKLTSWNFSCKGLAPWTRELYSDLFFVKACNSVVWSDPTTNCFEKRLWEFDLRHGKMDALFGILFAVLPNLEQLQLQNIELSKLTFFNFLFEPTSTPNELDPLVYYCCEYLEKKFAPRLARLQHLEMPRRWDIHSSLKYEKGASILNTPMQMPAESLICCESLRRFVAPETALFHSFGAIEVDPERSTLRKPCAILPQALESLTIFNVDFHNAFKRETHRVLDFLAMLFVGLLRSRQQRGSVPHCQDLQPPPTSGMFPSLHRVYIEYEETCAFYDHVHTLNDCGVVEVTQHRLQQMGKELGVELEFSFPWVGNPFFPWCG